MVRRMFTVKINLIQVVLFEIQEALHAATLTTKKTYWYIFSLEER